VSEAGPRVIAVSGARGFVASHLIPRLIASGRRIIGIVRPGRDSAALEAAGVEIRHADLTDPATSRFTFVGADALVHLSGIAQVPRFLDALESAGVRRAIFVGSAGVYTRLVSSGADAKRVGEARLAASSTEWTILRPSMIYGTPADRNLARLLRWLRRWPIVPVPGGGVTPQQPVHVEDLCAAIEAALDRPGSAGHAYDVGGPEPLSLAELIRISGAALGVRAIALPLPLGPAHLAARTARALRLPFPVSPEQVLRLGESKAVDISAAVRDLDFRPRPFHEGIAAEARAILALDVPAAPGR